MGKIDDLEARIKELECERAMDRACMDGRLEAIKELEAANGKMQFMLLVLLPLDRNFQKLAKTAGLSVHGMIDCIMDDEDDFFLTRDGLFKWTVDLGADGRYSVPMDLHIGPEEEVETERAPG